MKDKRPNTLQSKLGFLDEDLKKPTHDKLMLWLDKNIQAILNGLFAKNLSDEQFETFQKDTIETLKKVVTDRTRTLNRYITESRYYEDKSKKTEDDQTKLRELTEKIAKENIKIDYVARWEGFKCKPERPNIFITKKTWELPITTQGQYQSGTSNKYTVGFVDMAVEFGKPRSYISGIISDKQPEITGNHHELLHDLSHEIQISYYLESTSIYIEVKTEIKSLGELIRQINHYKEYLKGHYYILCPDNPYKSVLHDQGIGTIDYIA